MHLREGAYGALSGEVMPWVVPDSTTFRGVGDVQVHADLQLGQALFSGTNQFFCTQVLRVESVQFTGTGSGGIIRICSGSTLHMSDCSASNFAVLAASVHWDTQASMVFEDCRFTQLSYAVVSNWAYNYSAPTRFIRCHIDQRGPLGEGGLSFGSTGLSSIEIRDSLISRSTGLYALGHADRATHCTIVNNQGFGGSEMAFGTHVTREIDRCVIAFNPQGDAQSMHVQDSFVADGSGTHGGTVLSGDPIFVDAPGGDYRLRFDSPCIDRQPADSQTDLRGLGRNVDGTLDHQKAADWGAMEFRVLDGPAEANLGSTYRLEVSGIPMGGGIVYFSRSGSSSGPFSSPFGELHLPLRTPSTIAFLFTTGNTAVAVDLPVLGGPALVGRTLGFQALLRSDQVASRGAWSNPIEITIR